MAWFTKTCKYLLDLMAHSKRKKFEMNSITGIRFLIIKSDLFLKCYGFCKFLLQH